MKKQAEIIVAQEKGILAVDQAHFDFEFELENNDIRKESMRLSKLNKELLLFKEKFDNDGVTEMVLENESMKAQIQQLD